MNTLKKIIFFLCCGLFLHNTLFAQNAQPKIGLVLSGGGARGLAHISLLKALDSLNVKVDYIAGTSIGSIIGGLYAMGYSGKQIEQIAYEQNWNSLFENHVNLKSVTIEEKKEYSRYAVSLPIKKGQISLPEGVNNGQALTNTLTELFSPAYRIQDFDSLPIPFHCIATDIVMGEAVVLKSGNLGEAIRASMALPTFFPPIKLNGKLLSDGGLIQNFPVQEVKRMGADIVIGSYTGTALKKEEDLDNAINILYQTNSFSEIHASNLQKDSCDILFEPELPTIQLLDFDKVKEIIELGNLDIDGLTTSLSPYSTEFDDSLTKAPPSRLRIDIDRVIINGTKHVSEEFVLSKLHKTRQSRRIDFETLNKEIGRIFGSRLFDYAYFKVDLINEESVLTIQVKERERQHINFAIHYDSYNQVSAVFNITIRNTLLKNSRLLFTGVLSSRPKVNLSYLKYIGKRRNISVEAGSNFNNFELPVYSNNEKVLDLSYKYLKFYGKIQSSVTQNLLIAIGLKQEYTYLNSSVKLSNFLDQKTHKNAGVYAQVKFNSFDRWYFPKKGTYLGGEFTYNFGIHSTFKNDTIEYGQGNKLSIGSNNKNFVKSTIDWRSVLSIGNKVALSGFINLGYITNDNTLLINGNYLGGVNRVSHLGKNFVGLYDMEVLSNTFAIVGMELRYEPIRNIFLSFPVNVLAYEYESLVEVVTTQTNSPDRIFGYGVSLGYLSLIGPIQLTAHNNQQINSWRFDFELGFYIP